jgi:mycothiol synthase
LTPENVTVHAFHPDDLESVVAVYNALEDALGIERFMSPTLFQMFLENVAPNSEKDTFVVKRDGRVIGYAECEVSTVTGESSAGAAVHLTEARVLERTRERPSEQRVALWRRTTAASRGAVQLFEAHGYQHVSTAYQMRIALDQPIPAQTLPAPFVLRPFEPEHARAVYDVQMEVFADNWDSEPPSFEEWARITLEAADVDPSLWQIAYEGDAIVGIALNRRYGEDVTGAFVHGVAVRHAWRRRGLGEALLRNSFAAFQARGLKHVVLYVNSDNETNAVTLYERVGMHIHRRTLAYRKILRGGAPEEGG